MTTQKQNAGPLRGRFEKRTLALLCLRAGFAMLMVSFLFAQDAVAQRKRLTLDELVIEGNIQKPEAFFILPRTNLNFEDLERKEDLKLRIIKSVEKAPF